MEVLVIIIKSKTKDGDQNIRNLVNIFSPPFFKPVILEFKENSNEKIYKSLMYSKEGPYEDNIIDNPKFAYTEYPCLLIKDTSVCFFNTSCMETIMKNIFEQKNKVDMVYLSKWNDECNNQVYLSETPLFGSYLKLTKTPHGSQAIFVFPESRDKLLAFLKNSTSSFDDIIIKYIKDNQLKVAVFQPSIVFFDSSLATSNSDFKKFNECVIKTNQQAEVNSITFLWLIVIFSIILLLFWALIQIEPNVP